MSLVWWQSAGHVHRPLLLFVIALNAIVVWEPIGKCSATDSIGEPFAASDIFFRGHGLIFLQRVLVFDNFFVLLVFRSKLSAFQGYKRFSLVDSPFYFYNTKIARYSYPFQIQTPCENCYARLRFYDIAQNLRHRFKIPNINKVFAEFIFYLSTGRANTSTNNQNSVTGKVL